MSRHTLPACHATPYPPVTPDLIWRLPEPSKTGLAHGHATPRPVSSPPSHVLYADTRVKPECDK
jgi:hypothetical protein